MDKSRTGGLRFQIFSGSYYPVESGGKKRIKKGGEKGGEKKMRTGEREGEPQWGQLKEGGEMRDEGVAEWYILIDRP